MELLTEGTSKTTIVSANKGIITGAFVLGLGLVVSAWIGANAFYKVHTLDNTLSVTGSATEDVQADAAKWTVSVSRTATEDAIGPTETRVSNDTQVVVDYFAAAKITADNIVTSPVYADQNYNNDSNAPRTYNVHEDITVQSDDPQLIQKLSKDINQLTSKGVLVSAQAPEYYVSTLPKIRVALIGTAVLDAKARAMAIASSTGQKVGALESASGGVVQVMAPNSVGDVNDYGSYDTSTIDKQVMVTAHATFYIN